MSAWFDAFAAGWWRLAAPLALAPFAVAGLAALCDRLLARCASPGLRALGWWAVALKLCLPGALLGALAPGLVPGTLADLDQTGTTSGTATGFSPDALCAVWLVGALACATACAWRRHTLTRAWLRASVPVGPAVTQRARAAARRLGLARVPPVRVARDVPGPVLIGFARPTVLLPAALLHAARATDGDEDALELALLHELAHARRRDPLANLVTLLVQIVFWYHPLAWATRRRLLALAELSTDRVVVRALGDRSLAYRRTLARWTPSRGERTGHGRPGLAFAGATSQIVTRLEALRRPPRRDGPAVRAAALAVPLAALALGRATPPTPSPSLEQARAVAAVAPADLRGCLELRHAVLARMALAADERR